MAISQAITVSFKQDLMSPGGNLEAQTLKCALYDNTATLNQNTTAYITANEISASGTNYTTGGATLTNVAISTDGTTAIFDADNGGQIEHLPYLIKSLERVGTSAIIIEDKLGLKNNSLF